MLFQDYESYSDSIVILNCPLSFFLDLLICVIASIAGEWMKVSIICPKSSAAAEETTLFCWLFTGFNGKKKFHCVRDGLEGDDLFLLINPTSPNFKAVIRSAWLTSPDVERNCTWFIDIETNTPVCPLNTNVVTIWQNWLVNNENC